MTGADRVALAAFLALFITGISTMLWGLWDMMALPRRFNRRTK